METIFNSTIGSQSSRQTDGIVKLAARINELSSHNVKCHTLPEFKKITPANMPEVWELLQQEKGRTTDFSYAGVLMWVDYFNYEYSIYKDTLFIKGVVENDTSRPAFSLPIGRLPLDESVALLKEYCVAHGIDLEFSAVPEYALEEMSSLNPSLIEELSDWGDYLYDATPLSTLKGKKMSKKRNHVNQFVKCYDDWNAVDMTAANAYEAMSFMDIFDLEGDSSEMAREERELSRRLIKLMEAGDSHLEGMILYVGGKVCAYTIGDVKGDTLFVHVEKATRNVNGSYEMINYLFAKRMTELHPEIIYINREDDSGDIGLRMAKESYHPLEILRKYNVRF